MNEDVNGNRKLFWKEVRKTNGRNSHRIKDGNRTKWKRLRWEGFALVWL